MFFIFQKEVLITYDMQKYLETRKKLQQNAIPFQTRSTYIGSRGYRGNGLGTLGENNKYQPEYKIFVKKQNYENALHIINQKE